MGAVVSVKQLQSFWCKLFLTPNKKKKKKTHGLKSFRFFHGLPGKEVASPPTELGVVKTHGRKGEVMRCGFY